MQVGDRGRGSSSSGRLSSVTVDGGRRPVDVFRVRTWDVYVHPGPGVTGTRSRPGRTTRTSLWSVKDVKEVVVGTPSFARNNLEEPPTTDLGPQTVHTPRYTTRRHRPVPRTVPRSRLGVCVWTRTRPGWGSVPFSEGPGAPDFRIEGLVSPEA